MSAQAKPDQGAVFEDIRAVVRKLVEAGADGRTVCFSLAFVAAEFGMRVTREPLAVLPVLMNAFMRSASKFDAADSSGGPEAVPPPGSPLLH